MSKPLTAPELAALPQLCRFAELLERSRRERYQRQYGTRYPDLCDAACRVTVTVGPKWIRVNVGSSGVYMIDPEGGIFGIKAAGVPHLGHYYGTLGTVDDWNWGGYRAGRKSNAEVSAVPFSVVSAKERA